MPKEIKELYQHRPLIIELGDPGSKDVELVGGKSASLSKLAEISSVPPAFLITTEAYTKIISENSILQNEITELDKLSDQWIGSSLNRLPTQEIEDQILLRSKNISTSIKNFGLPFDVSEQIKSQYQKLSLIMMKENLPVAVRSSGVAEDMPGASFAGQYDTYLNQRGYVQVLDAVTESVASQFTDRAVTYRNQVRLDMIKNGNEGHEALVHSNCKLAVAVQAMVESKISGVGLSIEPESASNFVSIELSYGLGESIVAGEVTPDSFLVDQNTGEIVKRVLGQKDVKTIYKNDGGTLNVKTSKKEKTSFSVTDKIIKDLSNEIIKISKYYGHPVDVEFGIDENGIWVLQSRPETVASKKDQTIVEMKRKEIAKGVVTTAIMSTGRTGSPGVGSGKVFIANSVQDAINNLKKGDILVTKRTDPDWNPILHLPSAVITDIGGVNCHAAIISRERSIPCIVGSGNATETLTHYSGEYVTLDAEKNTIYEGALPLLLTGEDIVISELLNNPTKTQIGLIISNPDTARRMHSLKELGNNFLISLLRIEFLLTEIGVHPRTLEDYDKNKISDKTLIKNIEKKIQGYKSGKDYYISKLSEGIAQFASVFPDSKITLRTTDFKTNEYGSLIGGNLYEKEEANPMMGWRGLIRSLSPENRETTKWEMEAIKTAREMGYKNIQVMFPVVRDPIELTGGAELEKIGCKGIFEIMNEVGLTRGRDGLQVGMMVEVPANVILIDSFIDTGLDFISFGTNDLTQFTLAVDRDGNENIQSIGYKETNPAVVEMVKHVIKRCNARGVKTGICGQAPSNNPDFVEMLIKEGVGSIGVMPDRFLPTYNLVRAAEKILK